MNIAVDFDNTLVKHTHNIVTDIEVMLNPPIDGAADFLRMLLNGEHKVYIFSVRARYFIGADTIRKWLSTVAGLSPMEVSMLEITGEKPIATIYLDDRAVRFEGKYPTMDELNKLAINWLGF